MRSNLRQARLGAGLTQEKLAEKLGISLRQYKRIESGQSLGIIEMWDALEDLFDIHQRTLREIHPDKEDNP